MLVVEPVVWIRCLSWRRWTGIVRVDRFLRRGGTSEIRVHSCTWRGGASEVRIGRGARCRTCKIGINCGTRSGWTGIVGVNGTVRGVVEPVKFGSAVCLGVVEPVKLGSMLYWLSSL